MARQGIYSKKKSPIDRVRWAVKRRWRWFMKLSKPKKALVIGGPILAFLIVTPLATFIYYYNDIADKDRLMNSNNTGVVLKDKNDKIFYSLGSAERRGDLELDGIADVTEKALISAEDKDFYNHSGFSIIRIAGSMYANILAGDATAYGGSTLTQQLAKNTLLSTEKSFLRKYQELTIAMAIEQRYSKDEILAMYLNSVYYGNNSFGIEEAAQNYFGIPASDLSLAQASMLIGVLPAPSAYSPVEGNPEYAKERQTTVLTRMVANGAITESEKDAALAVELTYQPPKTIDNVAPHFTEMVLSELYDKYGEERVKRSGYQVKTTLDVDLQNTAQTAIDSNISYVQRNGGSNASVVAIDPATGSIRALVGSADFENEDFGKVNMATSKRQPGSSFKPLYYAKALADSELATTTILKDEKSNFNGYEPQNATKRYYGDVTVRQALDWSLNIPAVKVMQRVGISNAIDQAKKMGISSLGEAKDYGLSLALGSAEVPLTEMTSAYSTFAAGGSYRDRTSIESINNKFEKSIFSASVEAKQVLTPQGAYLVSHILADSTARSGMFGSTLNVYGTDGRLKSVAVKTGTTDDSRDAWTIGYTPNLAVGVWVGNNDNTEMVSGGADMAGPIWKNIMKSAIGASNPSFERPSGIVEETVCTTKGRVKDVFLSTYIPASTCNAQPQKQEEEKQPEEEPEADPTPNNNSSQNGGQTQQPTNPNPGTGGSNGSGGGSTTPTNPTTPPTSPTTPTEPTTTP